mgnify:FL=1
MTNNTSPASLKIEVVDSSGKIIGRTYEKRAKGLVKKGRARFTDENRITLLPSEDAHEYIETEGYKMDERINTENIENISEENGQYTIESVMQCMKKILDDSDYIKDVLKNIVEIPSGDAGDCGSPGDIAGKAKAEAISTIVRERENTNQKLIDFYNEVYNDLKAQQFSASDVEKKIQLLNTLSAIPGIHSRDFEDNLTDRVKDLVSSIIGSLN